MCCCHSSDHLAISRESLWCHQKADGCEEILSHIMSFAQNPDNEWFELKYECVNCLFMGDLQRSGYRDTMPFVVVTGINIFICQLGVYKQNT